MKASGLILVAGFSPATRDDYAHVLLDAGFRSMTATDGLSALTKALALRPRVAVLDMALTGISGPEVARRLRDDASSIVLILVGSGAEHASQAGRFGYLREGSSSAMLLAAVLAHLAL